MSHIRLRQCIVKRGTDILRPADPKRFDGRQIVDFPFRSNDQGYLPVRTGPRQFNPTQIFVQPLNGGARRQLTATNYSHRNEVVSPDGQWIAFVADAAMRTDSAVAAESDSVALLPHRRREHVGHLRHFHRALR